MFKLNLVSTVAALFLATVGSTVFAQAPEDGTAGASMVSADQSLDVSAPPPDANRESLERFLASTETLQARFTQALYGSARDREALDRSSGMLTLKRPGRFRWDYTEPYEKTVVADGTRLWIFEADLEQVIVRPVGTALAANPAMLLSGQASLDETFRVLKSYEADGLGWLELEPRQKDSNFTTVRLALDGDTLRLMELVDGLDQVTRITFDDVVANPDVADEVFAFEPPDGVDVQGLDQGVDQGLKD